MANPKGCQCQKCPQCDPLPGPCGRTQLTDGPRCGPCSAEHVAKITADVNRNLGNAPQIPPPPVYPGSEKVEPLI